MSDNNNAGAIWTVVIVFLIVGIAILLGQEKERYRKTHPVFTTGAITGFSEGAKGERYVDYSFQIDTTTYKGKMTVSYCKDCHGCCTVGRQVKVRYAQDDPSNSDLVP